MPAPRDLVATDVRPLIPPEIWTRFWASVDCGEGDVCWYWRGPRINDGAFRIASGTDRDAWVSARAAVWEFLGYGSSAFVSLATDRVRCGNDLCIRPDHVRPRARRTPRSHGVLDLIRGERDAALR